MRRHARQNDNESKEDQIEAVIHLHVQTPEANRKYPSNAKTFVQNLFLDTKQPLRYRGKQLGNLRDLSFRRIRCSQRSIAALSIIALAGAVFLLVSFYPFLYLCSWWKASLPLPLPPPERTYEERVAFVEEHVKKNRKYLPLTGDSNMVIGPQGDRGYDIYDCPLQPLPYYPIEFPILDVIHNWPLDDTELMDQRSIHQGFCVFDYSRYPHDQIWQQIRNYQRAEVPFVVKNHPEVLKTVERWNTNDYMDYLLQNKVYRGEFSRSLSMMYWTVTRFHKVPKDFVPPTKMRPTTFEIWKERALAMENATLAANRQDDNSYLRFDGCESPTKRCDALHRHPGFGWSIYGLTRLDNGDFLHDELPWFSPRHYEEGVSKDFLVEPQKNRGMQCRFGAKGLTAEDHFDNERNFIAVLGGERRYVLGHPKNCKDMSLYPMAHPLERHSQVDWNAPNLTQFPNFEHVRVNEVVLQAGDVLYLPTYWFHHIVSLNLNYQCNARSGHSLDYDQDIYDCGFLYPWPAE